MSSIGGIVKRVLKYRLLILVVGLAAFVFLANAAILLLLSKTTPAHLRNQKPGFDTPTTRTTIKPKPTPPATDDTVVIIPCRYAKQWKLHHLLAVTKSNIPLVIYYAVGSETEQRVLQKLIENAKVKHEKEISTVFIGVTVSNVREEEVPTYVDLIVGVWRQIGQKSAYSYVFLLSQHYVPEHPYFVDSILSALKHNGAVGATCMLIDKPSTSTAQVKDENEQKRNVPVVLEKGWEILEGSLSDYFVVRRHSGFGSNDRRTAGVDSINAVSPNCLLLLREAFDELKIEKSKIEAGHEENFTPEHLRARMIPITPRSLQGYVAAVLQQKVDKSASESIRKELKRAFGVLKVGVELWEKITGEKHAKASSLPIDPSIVNEEKAASAKCDGFTVGDKVRCYADLCIAAIQSLEISSDFRSTDAFGLHLSVKLFDLRLPLIATNVTAVLHMDISAKVALPEKRHPTESNRIQLRQTSETEEQREHRLLLSSSTVPFGRITIKKIEDKLQFMVPSYSSHPQPLKLVWDAVCAGCCGFSSEILHFLYPLQRMVSVRTTMGKGCWCSGYPTIVQDTPGRLYMHVDSVVAHPKDVVVWIVHSGADTFWYFDRIPRPPDYAIGRSMYEFTRFPESWGRHFPKVDEIWVPGEFIKNLFLSNGFTKNVTVIPESMDTDFYDPEIRAKLTLPLQGNQTRWRKYCHGEGHQTNFKFFSNFKWEPRKGWKILFNAYYQAFGRKAGSSAPAAPVSLYVLTYLYVTDPADDILNITLIQNLLQAHLKNSSINLDDMPHFCIIAEQISETELAELHNAADAFVLPTRGEGWGLPIISAMSMGKPTIATYYSGQTAFMTPENSFGIDIDGLDELPRDSVYFWDLGKKWCIPSTSHTAQLMRYVVDNPAHAAAVGRRARKWIVENFGEEAVAKVIQQRLREVHEHVLKARFEVAGQTTT